MPARALGGGAVAAVQSCTQVGAVAGTDAAVGPAAPLADGADDGAGAVKAAALTGAGAGVDGALLEAAETAIFDPETEPARLGDGTAVARATGAAGPSCGATFADAGKTAGVLALLPKEATDSAAGAAGAVAGGKPAERAAPQMPARSRWLPYLARPAPPGRRLAAVECWQAGHRRPPADLAVRLRLRRERPPSCLCQF